MRGMKVKRFSKIKKVDDPSSRLKLCFEFNANEDPSADLHSVGLLISSGPVGWHGGKEWHYLGHAYILSDSKEALENAQKRLLHMGWVEISDT